VLDEPTNDLDMATLHVLEECLTEFPGSVLLVTHDRYFLDQVATQILAFNPYRLDEGKITAFEGLGQWEPWHSEEAQKAKVDAKKAASQGGKGDSGAAEAKKRKLNFNEQREFDALEPNIKKAEAKLEQLTEESQKPEYSANAVKLAELGKALTETQDEIDRLYARWNELES
jgi:ATP-binding cassette subfamily F protein uup